MKYLLLMGAISFAGCNHNINPDVKAEVAATPTGPCRDDETFDNGRCSPRIPGNLSTPVIAPTR